MYRGIILYSFTPTLVAGVLFDYLAKKRRKTVEITVLRLPEFFEKSPLL